MLQPPVSWRTAVIRSAEPMLRYAAAGGDGPGGQSVVSTAGERSVPPVTLRSVQQFASQDEYVVVMKEDLADWFSELYDVAIGADQLFDRLETGVLLCRYAATVDDVIESRDGSRDAAVALVYRERGVEAGSFQARVNIAAFLAWCRRAPLRMPDDVLFETSDLVAAAAGQRSDSHARFYSDPVGNGVL